MGTNRSRTAMEDEHASVQLGRVCQFLTRELYRLVQEVEEARSRTEILRDEQQCTLAHGWPEFWLALHLWTQQPDAVWDPVIVLYGSQADGVEKMAEEEDTTRKTVV